MPCSFIRCEVIESSPPRAFVLYHVDFCLHAVTHTEHFDVVPEIDGGLGLDKAGEDGAAAELGKTVVENAAATALLGANRSICHHSLEII